jgi:hypothetical protein
VEEKGPLAFSTSRSSSLLFSLGATLLCMPSPSHYPSSMSGQPSKTSSVTSLLPARSGVHASTTTASPSETFLIGATVVCLPHSLRSPCEQAQGFHLHEASSAGLSTPSPDHQSTPRPPSTFTMRASRSTACLWP